MVDLCTERAHFRYVPVENWARQRVVRGDGHVHSIGKVLWTALIDAFPDLSNTVHYTTADGDGNVAVEVSIEGTQAKDFGVLRNLGRHYDLPHVFLFHVNEQGLIDDIVAYWDSADWYRQLGHFEVD
jgi:ketosteroid isomerase-like protein